MIESNNCCVCCGRIIPEGFQYCRECYEDNEQMMAVKTMAEKRKKHKILWSIFRKKKGREAMQISVDKANMRIEDGKLIIDITSDIEKVLNAGKVQLGTLKEGTVFKIGDKEFIVLEHTEKGVGIIQKDFAFSSKFGTCADWRISDVRDDLNNGSYYDFIAGEVGADNIIPIERDLTSLDGLKDYGTCVDKITVLSVPEYGKFHKILGLKSKYPDWQWLLTPYSTPSNDYVRGVCVVGCGGGLGWGDCGYCGGVRPFLILNPSVLVLA